MLHLAVYRLAPADGQRPQSAVHHGGRVGTQARTLYGSLTPLQRDSLQGPLRSRVSGLSAATHSIQLVVEVVGVGTDWVSTEWIGRAL